MAAHKKDFPDQRQLIEGQLGAWRFLAKCALFPKAVTGAVQRMARHVEDLEAKLEEVSAERDRLALRLAGWEGDGDKKNGGGNARRRIDRTRHAERRNWHSSDVTGDASVTHGRAAPAQGLPVPELWQRLLEAKGLSGETAGHVAGSSAHPPPPLCLRKSFLPKQRLSS